MTLTPEQKAEGWIEWSGGDCPIKDRRTTIEYQMRAGDHSPRPETTIHLEWRHYGVEHDILAYRIIEAHGADAEHASDSSPGPEEGPLDMDCEAARRGYKPVRITRHVSGWPVGSVKWMENGGNGRVYNSSCTDFWYHKLGDSCELIDQPAEPACPTPFPASYDELVWDADGWSQTIIVDGKRPEWLRDDDECTGVLRRKAKGWRGRQWTDDEIAIRVRRREPKRETVKGWLCQMPAHIGATPVTYDLIDGEPDLSTINHAEDEP